ncbi:MAG: VOC family protein [Deltaproteobacteria bacterium]|nr:VOC family protein [Deltaproteobacteria bacterium]MBK8713263.1 VOC family protein [Deltaproteobacteria bacterium]MBP7288940.1 VOC family protein [Nannocystaceae bacterium]
MAKTKSSAPKLGYVIVYVPDVGATLEFYERAFGVERRFLHESGQYGELATGSTALAFADEDLTTTGHVFERNRPAAKAAGAEVAFVVDDVAAAFARAVAAGASAMAQPSEKPWGQTLAYVRDLNGFLVELCTEVTA